MNNDISIGETLAVVVLGMAVVFAVLMLLWVCIAIESKVVAAMQEKQAAAEPAPAAAPAAPAPAATPAPLAKGSCGPVMLHDVPDRTAAMVMAIVADELKTPLNELRFISIKEVK
jgi:Na+-transporting methylmalonyl-CoA/oxaloacetate decarboxylase gamma subunit